MVARIDLSGQKFTRLTALKWLGGRKYECVCECGTKLIVSGAHLRSGHTRSCGCLMSEIVSQVHSYRLVGEVFGRLRVIECIGSDNSKNIVWRCKCDCGAITEVISTKLIRGFTKSCGCLMVDARITHGGSKTKSYSSWHRLTRRCLDPNDHAWKYYGGRGIKVCDRWVNSYENFVADMGEPPENHSIDRIDVNGNYELGNCRWATPKQQAMNTRRYLASRKNVASA